MFASEKRKLRKIVEAGNDLVAAIERANWGTISHPTLHMTDAVAVWKECVERLYGTKVQ